MQHKDLHNRRTFLKRSSLAAGAALVAPQFLFSGAEEKVRLGFIGTGYRGRIAVYELMRMTDQLRRLTADNADGVTLYEAAVEGGFLPMREDAIRKVEQGMTDQAEVFRVLH